MKPAPKETQPLKFLLEILHIQRWKRPCTSMESAMDPTGNLPAEVLGDIFAWTVLRFYLDALERGRYLFPFNGDRFHPHEVHVTLRSVCRRWREVMDATPSVWQTILLGLYFTPDFDMITRFVTYSRALPLDIFLDRCALHAQGVDFRQHISPLLAQIMPRIRVLILHLNSLNELKALFPTGVCTEAPNMCVLGLFVYRDTTRPSAQVIGTINAPSLSSLFLERSQEAITHFTPTSLLVLQRLTMTRCRDPNDVFLNALSLCRNIRSLHWSGPPHLPWSEISLSENSGPPCPELAFPSLQSLHFDVEYSPAMKSVFERFHAPALAFIQLNSEGAMSDTASSFLNLHLLSVRKLNLCRMALDDSGNMLLNHFPRLTSLGIFDSSIRGRFFNELTSHHDTDALPSLEELVISDSSFDVSDLAGFVHHRALSRHSPLKSVEIRGFTRYMLLQLQDLICLQETCPHILKIMVED